MDCTFASTINTKFTVIYRLPDTSIISFITDLTDYLERNINDCFTTVLLGDFSIHVNKMDNHITITFNDFLDRFRLINRVSFPTHRLDNTLDLIHTHKTSNTITRVNKRKTSFRPSPSTFQHHKLTIYHRKRVCFYRKLKNINTNQFKEAIMSALSNTDLESLDASSSSILYSNMLIISMHHSRQKQSLINSNHAG